MSHIFGVNIQIRTSPDGSEGFRTGVNRKKTSLRSMITILPIFYIQSMTFSLKIDLM